MIQDWINVAMFKKSPEQVAKEASMKDGFVQVAIAGLVLGLVMAILGGIGAVVSGGVSNGIAGAGVGIIGALVWGVIIVIASPILAVVGLAIVAGIVHLVATILFKGKGSYGEMVGTMGVISASISMTIMLALEIISGVLGIISIGPIAILVIIISMPIALVRFVAVIAQLYLTIRGVAAVQKFSLLNAALSILIPMIVIGIVVFVLVLIAALIFGAALFALIAGAASSAGANGLFGLM